MLKAPRILAGVVVLTLILAAASLAVQDCQIALFTYENCIWLRVRDALHLPQSKFLRGLTLELVGVCLLAGVFLTIRYIFPARCTRASAADPGVIDKAEITSNPPRSP